MAGVDSEVLEAERLSSLRRYGLDINAEDVTDPDLEMVATMAAQVTGAAHAGVHVVDGGRQVRLAGVDAPLDAVSRIESMCAVAMWRPDDDGVFVTLDGVTDPLFAGNPKVAEMERVVYAAAPLTGREGLPLGTLCVWDEGELPEPTAEQRAALAKLAGFVVRILDLRRRAAEMERDAMHDALTGLPNRRLLRDRLAQALARRGRGQSEPLLVLVDLDRFKEVNDVYGHAAGDAVLIAMADRLRGATRLEDTVARLGGDEFVVLCDRVRAEHSDLILRRLAEGLQQPLRLLSGEHLELSASVGVAFAEADDDSDTLLAKADAAMYEQKRASRR